MNKEKSSHEKEVLEEIWNWLRSQKRVHSGGHSTLKRVRCLSKWLHFLGTGYRHAKKTLNVRLNVCTGWGSLLAICRPPSFSSFDYWCECLEGGSCFHSVHLEDILQFVQSIGHPGVRILKPVEMGMNAFSPLLSHKSSSQMVSPHPVHHMVLQ